jgi:hypothetical protein
MRCLTLLVVLSLAACQSSSPRGRGEPHLEMYNVQDLVVCAGDMGHCDIPDHAQGCRQFERKAKTAVADAPWDDETGWTVVFQNGLLIVRADDETQHSVQSFLASERSKVEKK